MAVLEVQDESRSVAFDVFDRKVDLFEGKILPAPVPMHMVGTPMKPQKPDRQVETYQLALSWIPREDMERGDLSGYPLFGPTVEPDSRRIVPVDLHQRDLARKLIPKAVILLPR